MARTSERISKMLPACSIVELSKHLHLIVVRSSEFSCWMVFKANTAELIGRIDERWLLENDEDALYARLAELGGEMGALYALQDEARVAPSAKRE